MSASEITNYRILMIDDDHELCETVSDFLAGYGFTVTFALDGTKGLHQALEEPFDAVLLDMMLPGTDGLAVLRQLHIAKPRLPIVIISAQSDVSDRIVGLEMGADDYVPKTFAPRELLARLRAVIRRTLESAPAEGQSPDETAQAPINIHGLHMDAARMEAELNGQDLALSAIEFRLLYALASQPGKVLSREYLLREVSGREYVVFERSIDMHISSLRKKMGDDPAHAKYVRTVRSFGYMFMK